MDPNRILCIISLSAIISPVLVAFLNNWHDYLIKKLENITKVKQDVLSKFANVAFNNWSSDGFNKDFYNALNLLYIYFDIDDELVSNIIENIPNNAVDYQEELAKFMKSLSKQIDK